MATLPMDANDVELQVGDWVHTPLIFLNWGKVTSINDLGWLLVEVQPATQDDQGPWPSPSWIPSDQCYLIENQACPECGHMNTAHTGGVHNDQYVLGRYQAVDVDFYRCNYCEHTWAD